MNIEVILKELRKNFQLKENHILIIRALVEKKLTAEGICEKTGIPKGRIYELLNELISLKLIQRKRGTPSYYVIEDLESNTLKFLRSCFDNLMERQQRVISLLSKEGQKVEVVTDREKCIFLLREALSKDNDFRVVFGSKSVPFFFYPEENKKYLMVRKEFSKKRETLLGDGRNVILVKDSYIDACRKGKKFKFLITEDAFKLHMKLLSGALRKRELREVMLNIRKYLQRYRIGLRVTKGHIFNYIYSTNSETFIIFFSPSMVIGLLIKSRNAANAFSEMFDDVYKKSSPVERYLGKV